MSLGIMSRHICLQGGTLLVHDANDHVTPLEADLLIEGSIITKIGKSIMPPADAELIDCRDKIISPGFIDTHRHMWQTQHKGKHGDASFVGYLPRGNFTAVYWTAEDLFWGELAGALESINAGTTTCVDHASCHTGPDHPHAAVQALLSAGLRTVYCYTGRRQLVSQDAWTVKEDDFTEENLAKFHSLAKSSPYSDRVYMGYAIDNIHGPPDMIKSFFADLRDKTKGHAKVITLHDIAGPIFPGPTTVQKLHVYDLLGPDILISHANSPGDKDGQLFRDSGAHLSSTPSSEMQAGNLPTALRPDHLHSASVGVDCHSWGSASIPQQARMLLGAARMERGLRLTRDGVWSKGAGFSVEQVFNLSTLGGARAVGMEGEVGSLKEGMKADLVVFDASSPSMLAAAVEDPVAAVVLHSSPADVSLVMVDGVIRKRGGRLEDVKVAAAPEDKNIIPVGETLTWKQIARKVIESRNVLEEKVKGLDFESGTDHIIDLFHLRKEGLVENAGGSRGY
ncbi:hypothetical protein PspLS_01875 [Pyricularia sp. CBS 133598]|nr:hypothetical protein PspLS_01875 [Pyricularia sp. CBS 133598]